MRRLRNSILRLTSLTTLVASASGLGGCSTAPSTAGEPSANAPAPTHPLNTGELKETFHAVPAASGPSAAPTLGTPFPLSAPVSGAPDHTVSSYSYSVAFDGTNYLLVWRDGRAGVTGNDQIYGARISPAGVLLDPAGFSIGQTPSAYQMFPQVAYDATDHVYLVTWVDRRTQPKFHADIYAATVTTAGKAGTPFQVSSSGNTMQPAVAWNGSSFLVAWSDSAAAATESVYAARVTAAGVVQDPSGIAITRSNYGGTINVAAVGATFVVTWSDTRNSATTGTDVYAARVSSAGALLDPSGVAICTATGDQYESAIGTDGTNLLVTWQDFRKDATDAINELYGARVTGALVVNANDTTGFRIAAPPAGSGAGAVVATAPGSYFVSWDNGTTATTTDTYGTDVLTGGSAAAVSAVNGRLLASNAIYSTAGFDGKQLLVVGSGGQSDDPIGTFVSLAEAGADAGTDAGASPPFSLIAMENEQSAPAAAFDGTNYLVVWSDTRSRATGADIYAAFVSPAGVVQAPGEFAVASSSAAELWPAVAWNGKTFLVTWTAPSSATPGIYSALVSPAGAVTPTSGAITVLGLANGTFAPSAVASNGTDFYVVWDEATATGATVTSELYGTGVTGAGVLASTSGSPIATKLAGTRRAPAITYGGGEYVAVWSDSRPGTAPHTAGLNGIFGARISPTTGVLDANGSALDVTANNDVTPQIAFDGTNFLVAWEATKGPTLSTVNTGGAINAMAVSPSFGVVVPATPLVASDGAQTMPGLAFDGQNYLVSWRDQLSASAAYSVSYFRMSPSWQLLDGAGLAVSVTGTPAGGPVIARGASGSALFVYEQFDSQSTRVTAATFAEPPLGDAGAPIDASIWGADGGTALPGDAGADAHTPPGDAGADAHTPPGDAGADAHTPPGDAGADAHVAPLDAGADATASTGDAGPNPPQKDAGPGTQPFDAGPPVNPSSPTPAPHGGGSCQTSHAGAPTSSAAWFSLAALAFGFTRRRRNAK